MFISHLRHAALILSVTATPAIAGVLQTPTGGFVIDDGKFPPKPIAPRATTPDDQLLLTGVFGTPTGGWGIDRPTPPRPPRLRTGALAVDVPLIFAGLMDTPVGGWGFDRPRPGSTIRP